MAQRNSFREMKAEQAKLTESWKAEGRLSEAWAIADPEIVEIFSAGVAFGMEIGRRGRSDPAYSPDEWRKALREAVAKAADIEEKLENAKDAIQKKVNE
jgi:hypothetical protein